MTEKMLSVVMPAYNEASHIKKNVAETVQTLHSAAINFEIVVVDDGSDDGTHIAAAAAHFEDPERVRVVRYDRNRGKGNALMCGASFARGDFIAFLDSDLDLHPSQLLRFVALMNESKADVIVGSKFHPASKVNYPKKRRIYSRVYYALIRILFNLPLRDTQTGIKIFRRSVVEAVFPRILVKRFAFDVEVLANVYRLGFKIIEAPVELKFQRSFGRISPFDIYYMMVDTLAIFYRLRVLRYYDKVSQVTLARLHDDSMARELALDENRETAATVIG